MIRVDVVNLRRAPHQQGPDKDHTVRGFLLRGERSCLILLNACLMYFLQILPMMFQNTLYFEFCLSALGFSKM